MPLMLCMVCYAMVGALALYYRSLGIASTLLRRGNISGRPCIGVMTCKALSFSASTTRQLSPVLHHRALKTLKPIKWCISGGNALFWLLLELHVYFY
jgi:hypothetical protein